MDFRKTKNSPNWVGSTFKGKTISYQPIQEDKIVFFDKNEVISTRDVNTSTFIPEPLATKIILNCNFTVTAPMLDELQSSKILEVGELCNDRKQIVIYPLPFFDYIKLHDVLFDLSKKFDL